MTLILASRTSSACGVGIAATLATRLAFGSEYACVGLGVWCLAMMVALYQSSRDALDSRAVLYNAAFIFVVAPMIEIALSGVFDGGGVYAPAIRGVVITEAMFVRAQTIIVFGLLSLSVPMMLARTQSRPVAGPLDPAVGCVPRAAWWMYGALLGCTAAFVLRSYGGVSGAMAMAFDPVARDLNTRGILSGVYGFLFVATVAAAYYASQRLRLPVLRLGVFVPAIPLILPAANRGALITALLVAAVAAWPLIHRRVYVAALAVLALFPLMSVSLLALRFALAEGEVPLVAQGGPALNSYLTEATMAPALAYVVEMLRVGRIDFAYGTDILLLFVWFVPRVIWPGKPFPLDFRLNEVLQMNYGRAYGTPISLFGGAYVNFTPVLYWVFLIGVGWIIVRSYSYWRRDRLMAALLMTLVVDLVRVGDITREVWTFLISAAAALAVRYVILRMAQRRTGLRRVGSTPG